MFNHTAVRPAATKLILFALLAILIAKLNAEHSNRDGGRRNVMRTNDEDRIIGGQKITIDQFPYIVQILDRYAFMEQFHCGGTVISERHIITAAHCVVQFNLCDMLVVANATFRGDKGIQRDVVAKYVHPDYDPGMVENDVAILTLDKPLPMGKGIQKAEMCKKSWRNGDKVMVAGWGKTRAKKLSKQLQTVTLNGITNKRCQKLFDKPSEITKNMSCTLVRNRKDACNGDSGGPAFFNGTLCGIVSFGYDCARTGYPSVFTKIPKLRKFIRESMRED